MKKFRFIVFVLMIGTLVLSACGAAAATPAATSAAESGKAVAMPIAFVGSVESIAGDQWVISGTTVTVDPSVVRDGPFAVGDQVKVEGIVNADGSFTVSRVEAPAPQDVATLPPFGDDNANDVNVNDDNGNDANINDDHGVDANINDDHGGATNVNDDNSNTAPSSNTNDDHSGKSGKGSGGGKGGGGNDNGGNSNDG